jgi:hypothetical protein
MGGGPQQLLTWGWVGPLLTAAIARARYSIRADRTGVRVRVDVWEAGGLYRFDLGLFPSGAVARDACERDAQLRCGRGREERGPVDVRISPGRRRGSRGLQRAG